MKHILAPCLFVVLCAPAMAQSSPDAKSAAPEQKTVTTPAAPAAPPPVALTCVYNSKTYSDGAYVCVNKNLVLMCSADSTKAVWNAATDKDASDKVRAPCAALDQARNGVRSGNSAIFAGRSRRRRILRHSALVWVTARLTASRLLACICGNTFLPQRSQFTL